MIFVSCNRAGNVSKLHNYKVTASVRNNAVEERMTHTSARINSYQFSRVAIWLRAESTLSVTIACSTFRVDELTYRTSPTMDEPISRHIFRADDVETFQVDPPMLDYIRRAMTRFSVSVRREAADWLERDKNGSNWFVQPKHDGWLAMFDGRPADVQSFRRWLSSVLT
jgi:hypothetical protein